VLVSRPDANPKLVKRWRKDPKSEWTPFWGYGAMVDVRDVAAAARQAIECDVEGHVRALLCGDQIAASRPSLEMAAALMPGVPIRDPGRFERDPWASLVDTSVARDVLGWRPVHAWREPVR
jgi:nucleoside-diphosphate-sugar epimerase